MAAIAAGLLLCSGCVSTWPNPFAPAGPPAPVVLAPNATAHDIVAAIQANSQRVQSYAANGVSISMLGMPVMPSLSGNILLEPPTRFRLQARSLLGPEVDLGSGDQWLWMWIKQSETPGVYMCRREQFAASTTGQSLPIDPAWLQAALGVVTIDPSELVEGPVRKQDGTFEIRVTKLAGQKQTTRVLNVDATRAWVLKQFAYDANGTLLASAEALSHQYYPEHQVSLPRLVRIHVPTAQLALSIDIGQVHLNTPLGDAGQMWLPPQIDGVPQVDICGRQAPGVGMQPPGALQRPVHRVGR